MLEIIDGDILAVKTKYIAHQCNLLTVDAAGVAKAIFDAFPYADIYKERLNNKTLSKDDLLGNFILRGNGKDQRYVINMMCQKYPGKPKFLDNKIDGIVARENHFASCLERISWINQLDSIAFPYGIGCNLAGGNWNHYLKMLEEFSAGVSAKVFLIRKC